MIRRTEDHDWVQVWNGGVLDYEGHSIPDFYWEDLLRKEFDVELTVINDWEPYEDKD